MDVYVSRSGGFAGLRLTWHVHVEEQPDRDDWYLLIRQIPWSDAPPVPPEPDRYVYRIRCESHVATLAERQVTGPWRTLVERVQETAEPERARPADGDGRPPSSPSPSSTKRRRDG